MKNLFLITLLTLSSLGIFAQDYKPTGIAYWDALTLLKCQNNTAAKDTILTILSYYSKKKIKTENDAKITYNGNLFIVKLLPKLQDKTINNQKKEIDSSSSNNSSVKVPKSQSITSALSSIASLDITNIADGMAKFIVKRTKEELSITFFEKFQRELDSIPDLKYLLPKTYCTLSSMGSEIYSYENYINTIVESFKKDIKTLPTNLPNIVTSHKEYFDKRPDFKAQLLTAFYIAQAIDDNQHPGDIIENYDVSILDSVKEKNIKPAFQTFQLFSNSLQNNKIKDSIYWISYSDIKNLVKDEDLLNIYLGLIFQKAKNDSIRFTTNNEPNLLADILIRSYNNLQPYKTYLLNVAVKTQSIESQIKALKTIKNDSILFENYYKIISSTIGLMRYAVQVDKLPVLSKDSLNLEQTTKIYFDLAQTSSDIVIDVHRKNYTSAILNTGQLIKLFNRNRIIQINHLKQIDSVKYYLSAQYINAKIIVDISEHTAPPSRDKNQAPSESILPQLCMKTA